MSIIRTATTTLVGLAVATTALVGSAATASAKPVWCEPAAPYACSRWAAETAQQARTQEPPEGFTRAQYLKLLSVR